MSQHSSIVSGSGQFSHSPSSSTSSAQASFDGATRLSKAPSCSLSFDDNKSFESVGSPRSAPLTKQLSKTFSSIFNKADIEEAKADQRPIDAQGYITKNGKRGSTLTRRYFVLRGKNFSYYTDESLSSECGSGTCIRLSHGATPLALFLTSGNGLRKGDNRIFQLTCESEADLNYWFHHFSEAIKSPATVKRVGSKQDLMRRFSVETPDEDAMEKMKKLEEEKRKKESQRLEEEKRAKEEALRKAQALEQFQKYKADLIIGIEVKKHHLRKSLVGKKNSAVRTLWVDPNLTCVCVASAKTDDVSKVEKKFVISDVRSVAAFEDSATIAVVHTFKGQVLKIEMQSSEECDKFIKYLLEIRDETISLSQDEASKGGASS